VEPVGFARLGGKPVAWREFLRQRTGGGPAKAGYGFRIRFHGDGGRAGGFGRGEPLWDRGIGVDRMGKIEETKEE